MSTRPIPAPETLERQLLALIRERLLDLPEEFTADANLYEAGLDSMGIMHLLLMIEREYGLTIPDNDLTRHQLSAVRHLAALICERGSDAR